MLHSRLLALCILSGSLAASLAAPLASIAAPQQCAPPSKSRAISPASNEKSAPQHRFAVQVGAFSERSRAEALLTDLMKLFAGSAWIQIEPLQTQSGTLHRLRILVSNRAEARAVADRLKRDRNIDAWITPLPPK